MPVSLQTNDMTPAEWWDEHPWEQLKIGCGMCFKDGHIKLLNQCPGQVYVQGWVCWGAGAKCCRICTSHATGTSFGGLCRTDGGGWWMSSVSFYWVAVFVAQFLIEYMHILIYTAYIRMTRVYKAQTASLKLACRSRSNLVASSWISNI